MIIKLKIQLIYQKKSFKLFKLGIIKRYIIIKGLKKLQVH